MAVYYVKPETAGGSPSGAGSVADPWNGLADIDATPFSDGDTLILNDGTYTSETYTVDQTRGSGGLLIRAATHHGVLMDGNADTAHGIIGTGREHIHIEGIRFLNYTSSAITFRSSSSRLANGCTIAGCTGKGGASGFSIGPCNPGDNIELLGHMTNVVIDDCSVDDVSSHGISLHGRGTIRNSTCNKASNSTDNRWGIYAKPDAFSYKTPSPWDGAGTGVRSIALTTLNALYTTKVVVGVVATGRTPGSGPYILAENTGTPTTPSVNEFGFSSGTVYINIGEDPDNKSIIMQFSITDGVLFENNITTNSQNDGGNTDGVGIGFDIGMQNSIMRYNFSANNQGDGIQFNIGVGHLVYGNVSVNNDDNGLSFPTTSGNCQVYHNYTAGNATSGIDVKRLASGETITIRNNIINEATDITETNIDGTLTQGYNHGVGTSGTGSLQTLPQVSTDYKTTFTSDGHRAGLYIAGFHDTYNNNGDSWGDKVSIGLDDNGYSERKYKENKRNRRR
jgi:hypothetical protein